MALNISIKSINITSRRVVLACVGLLVLVGLFFVVMQILKVSHPAYPVVQAILYQFEKTTDSKVTFDSIRFEDGRIVLHNVYTDVQKKGAENKTILFAEQISVARDLSTIITNVSLSSPTDQGILTVGLRDVRLSHLKIEQGQFRGGRLELASLFLAGEAAPAQIEAFKRSLRASLGVQKEDFALFLLNKLPQTGVAVDLTLKTPSLDQWVYTDRWYVAGLFDLSNRAMMRGVTQAIDKWRKGQGSVAEQPFTLPDGIQVEGMASIFKNLGIMKTWLGYFAKESGVSEQEALAMATNRLSSLEETFVKDNPQFQTQGHAFFQGLTNLVTGKKNTLSVSFEPDPEMPNAGKVFKVLP
ncbi:MAG: hypothetical protein ACKO57_03040 [Alphaproteobacteria bacterium]